MTIRPEWPAPRYLAAIFMFVIFFLTSHAFWFSPFLTEEADMASNALQVERAKEGREMLGPYSRFEFSHPGPIAFYGQALSEPLFFWLPSHMARHLAGEFALSLILILWSLRLLVRAGLHSAVAVAGVFLLAAPLIFLGGGNMFMLASVWGPTIVVFPMLLFVIAVARVNDGDLTALPAAALGATISYQTHLMTVPVLAVGSALTLVAVAVRRQRMVFWPEGRLAHLCVWSAVGVFVISLVPPLIEQFSERPGNLALIWEFARDNDSTVHAWPSVLHHLGQAFTDPLVVLMEATARDWNSPGIVVMIILLLGSVSVAQFRRSLRPWRLILLAVWTAIATVFVAARHVHGELYPYLFYYLYALVGMLYLFVGKEIWDRWLCRRVTRKHRAEVFILLGGLAVLVPWTVFHPIAPGPRTDRFEQIVDRFQLSDLQAIHLVLGAGPQDGALWGQLPTYALQFRRADVAVTVDEKFVFLCGKEMRPRAGSEPPVTLVFTKQAPVTDGLAYLALESWGIVKLEAGEGSVADLMLQMRDQ